MFLRIKKQVDRQAGNPEELIGPLLETLQFLLDGLTNHAIKGNEADFEKFKADVGRLAAQVQQSSSPGEIVVAAGAAVKALECYNHQTGEYLRGQTVELQATVKLLTDAIAGLAPFRDNSVRYLQNLEHRIEQAAALEDYRGIRERLKDCLESIGSEIQRQREESARHKAEMADRLRQLQVQITRPAGGADGPVARTEAECAVAAAVRSGRRIFAAVLVIQRLHVINTEYGYAVGDRVLDAFRENVSARLINGDTLIRWSGPAFLLLLERSGSADVVEREISYMLAQKPSIQFELDQRSVFIPVSATHSVVPVFGANPETITRRIDAFVVAQLPGGGTAAAD